MSANRELRQIRERRIDALNFPRKLPHGEKRLLEINCCFIPIAASRDFPQFCEAEKRRALRVLVMVHELHEAGYQKIRICPGMSSSGCNWRCAVTPGQENIESKHGAMSKRYWDKDVAAYTSGQKNDYFDWKDAKTDTARELAVKLIEQVSGYRKGRIGRGLGIRWWYVQMLGFVNAGEFPVAYADWWEEPDPRWLPTDKGIKSNLPMPPLTPRSGTR